MSLPSDDVADPIAETIGDMDCGCPYRWRADPPIDPKNPDDGVLREWHLIPCPHVQARMQKAGFTSLEEWIEAVQNANPEEYRSPPPPPRPAVALTNQARIDLYTKREAEGFSLYNPNDVVACADGVYLRYCPIKKTFVPEDDSEERRPA